MRPVQYAAPGKEIFPELLPPEFASHEANFVLPLVVAFPPGFFPPGGQVFHARAFVSRNVTYISVFQEAIQRSFRGCRIQIRFHLAM